jgi:hypothetical protein
MAHLTSECQVKYVYRRVPFVPHIGPGPASIGYGMAIALSLDYELKDHDSELCRPLPLLCNIRLVVARVLKMSGATNIIAQLMKDVDDSKLHPVILLAS